MIAKIIENINEIKKEEWNSLIREDDIQLSYEFTQAIQESKLNDFLIKYIIVEENNKIIGIMPIFLTNNFFVDIPLMGVLKKITNNIKKVFPNFLRIKVLFCGSPVSEYNVLLLNPDYNKKEVLKLILSKFEEYAKREKVGYTAFKDYKNIDKDLFKVILKYKYNKVYSMPGTFIISNSNSFEEYLLTLKKKYRLNIKNKINKSKKIENLKTELIDDYFDIINKIFPLYESTYNYATGKFEKLNKNFFYNINKYLKNNSKLIITKYKDKIIGFALLLFTKNICINMRMGLDYKYAFKFHTYFLILYKNLEFIFNNKIATLYLSQSTYRPKLEIGADIQVLDAFVKHKNLIYNVLMGVSCFLLYIKYRILSKSKEPHKTLKKIFPQLFKH